MRMPDADARGGEVEARTLGKMRWTIGGLMNVRAKKPRTTLGMPARISRIGLIVRRTFGVAYSDR